MSFNSRWIGTDEGEHFNAVVGAANRDYKPLGPADSSGTESVTFVHPSHAIFARMLDEQGILWQYKPRTFAVEWDEEGNFLDSVTPDFYLPAWDRYVEVDCFGAAQVRTIRLLQQQYPGVRIDLFTPVYPFKRSPVDDPSQSMSSAPKIGLAS